LALLPWLGPTCGEGKEGGGGGFRTELGEKNPKKRFHMLGT
jgi:hypothetical protein